MRLEILYGNDEISKMNYIKSLYERGTLCKVIEHINEIGCSYNNLTYIILKKTLLFIPNKLSGLRVKYIYFGIPIMFQNLMSNQLLSLHLGQLTI